MSTEEKTPENNVPSNQNNKPQDSAQNKDDGNVFDGLIGVINKLIGDRTERSSEVVLSPPLGTEPENVDTIPITRTAEQEAEIQTAIDEAVQAKMQALETQLEALLPKDEPAEEKIVPAVVPQTPTPGQRKSKVEIFKEKYAQNARAGAKYFADNQAEILRESNFFVNR